MMRTANPALSDNVFRNALQQGSAQSTTMTIQGTVNRVAILLSIAMVTAAWAWMQVPPLVPGQEGQFSVPVWGIVGLVGGLIFALITIFKKTAAPTTAPMYAALEGLFLGSISAVFEALYPGIVIQAIMATFGTLGALLLAYKSGMIKPTENFKLGVVAATGGIFLIYMMSWIMSFFGAGIPMIHESGPIGIGFSVFVIIVAALNLVLDFDFIENGEEMAAPKYMEWYAAFGLMVTLVWLYIEFLRLLAKLRDD